MEKTMPSTHKTLVRVSCTIVVVLGMFARALPASLSGSTSSTQDEAGNVTGEMQPLHRPNTAHNHQAGNVTREMMQPLHPPNTAHNHQAGNATGEMQRLHPPNTAHNHQAGNATGEMQRLHPPNTAHNHQAGNATGEMQRLHPPNTAHNHQAGNVTGEMQPLHHPNTARNYQGGMSTRTTKVTHKVQYHSKHNDNLASQVESQSHSPDIRQSSESQDASTRQTINKEIQVHPHQRQEIVTLQTIEAKTQRRAHYVSDTSSGTDTQAYTTRRFLPNQNVSTALDHWSASQLASTRASEFETKEQPTSSQYTGTVQTKGQPTSSQYTGTVQTKGQPTSSQYTGTVQTKGQPTSSQYTGTAQTDNSQTSRSASAMPVTMDWTPHCGFIERTPTPTVEAADCPPTPKPSERLQGKIEWDLDSLDCRQELFVLNYRVPEGYGFVLEFHLVSLKENDILFIYSVELGTETEKKRLTKESLDLAPLMLHTNNMQIVLCSQYGLSSRAKFNMSYKAHSRSSIPHFTKIDIPGMTFTTSRYIYYCYDIISIPEAISCDGIRHCELGEDESYCPYRDEGCGDWYPHNDQCIKAVLAIVPLAYPTETAPSVAEMHCQRDNGATLAVFQDSAGQEIMTNMIRNSGSRHAAVGLRRVQPVSPKLSHLYRFLWQWGKRGSPIAYDLTDFQRTDALNDCAQLNLNDGKSSFRVVPCFARFLHSDSYICMRPNPLRLTQKMTLSRLALPGATSPLDKFPTKACPDGSVVQTFHTCQWGRREEEEDLASAVSPNNFPLFQCRTGQAIHYSLICDGKFDCSDLSDEKDCRDPRFPPLLQSSFICRNSQELPKEKRCDGMQDCYDGSDEESCVSCQGEQERILCPGLGCLTVFYGNLFTCPDSRGSLSLPYYTRLPARVILDGRGLSWLPPARDCEGLYQCREGFCIPTFLLNNGEWDCPKGEDEDIPVYNMTCPGYYRCRGSGACVDTLFVCDGVHHCPDKDDEMYCHLACPHDSGCVCEGHAYKCSKMINPLDNLHVRYLDLSFAANVSLDDVHFMEYLAFLNLSFCRLANVTVRDMPQLQTLDLNLLPRLFSLSLVTLPGLVYLDLSHNPFVKTLTAEFTVMLQVGELKNLKALNLVNVGLTAIGSNIFDPLSKLTHLDVRANQLRSYSKESLHGLVSLEELYTDESNLCCPYFHQSLSRCYAPVDELSSCSDLLGKGIFKVCLWALAVLALVGNMGVLLYRLLLVRTRIALTAASILVKSLCASDMLMGVYLAMIGAADAQLSGTYVSREREWRSSVMCTVAGVLSLVSSEVSALVVSLITLDRVLVLCFPFKPQLHLTPRSAIFTCLGVWVAGVVLAVVPLLAGMEFYGQTSICIPLPITRQQFSGHQYAFGVFIIFNFVIFLFIGAGQLMIYRAVRKASAASGTASRSRDLTVARRLFLIVLTDFCCWFPVGVMGLLAASSTPIPGEVNAWAAIFVLPLNSALNPFLYTLNALLERSRQQRRERKIKKIVATLQNEISNFNAATVKDVIRICVRSGLVGKVAVDTMFDTTSGARPLTE